MKIVIIGGGVVGYSLAEQLLYEKHTISLIEADQEIGETIAEKMDLQVITASGSSPRALENAGIEQADMVIAVTPIDEINLLVCSIAKQYGVPQRIARLRSREFVSPDRHVSLIDLGVTDFIFPEQVVVDAILQYFETPGASDAINFENGNVLMRGYRIKDGMPMAGKSLIELRRMMEPEIFLVAAVLRDHKNIIPPGDFVIEPGDKVYSLFPRSAVESFLGLINADNVRIKKAIVTGSNLITAEVAAAIERKVSGLTLIDPLRQHAEEMAGSLARTEVIHGDCTDSDVLRSLDIKKADFFIASSEEADYNMMSALLAKAEGAREVTAVSMEYHHDRLFHSLGIDHVINPRVTAARQIMQIISHGHFGGVVRLGEADIEVLRLVVPDESSITGTPLKKIWKKTRQGALIGSIIRKKTMIVPDGETTFEPGDHVIVIAYTKFISQIQKLFKGKSKANV